MTKKLAERFHWTLWSLTQFSPKIRGTNLQKTLKFDKYFPNLFTENKVWY